MTSPEPVPDAVPAADAYRHRMAADGRESLAHMLVFPEAGIAGFIYPTVRADGQAKGRVSLFGPGLDEPVAEQVEMRVAADMDFRDWRTGPLRMAVTAPHRRVELDWLGSRIRFRGVYEALHPAYAFSLHPGGNPPYYGDDRTEQHGRVQAELEVDGRRWSLSGYLIRDHSWGPRVWGLNQHYKWFHATTEAHSVHYFEMLSFGRRQLRGFLHQDGRCGHVVAADYDIVYDAAMMQTGFTTTVGDHLGRSVRVEARALANTQVDLDPMVFLNEAALVLDIGGRPGTGWVEFCWNRNYFDFARQHVERYG